MARADRVAYSFLVWWEWVHRNVSTNVGRAATATTGSGMMRTNLEEQRKNLHRMASTMAPIEIVSKPFDLGRLSPLRQQADDGRRDIDRYISVIFLSAPLFVGFEARLCRLPIRRHVFGSLAHTYTHPFSWAVERRTRNVCLRNT